MIAEVDHVLEHGRARRQICQIQEERVKRVATSGRAVYGGASLEDSGVVLRVIHADEGSVVVEGFAAPVFQTPQEVVQTSIGAKIVADAGPTGNGKWDVLAASDRHAVIRSRRNAAAEIGRIVQAVGVGPIAGEERDRFGDDGRRRVRHGIAAAAPEGIRGAAIVVALHVDRIFRGNGESALVVVSARRQVIIARGIRAGSNQFQNVACSGDRIAQTNAIASGGQVGIRRSCIGVHAEAVADVLAAPVVEESALIGVFGRIGVIGCRFRDAIGPVWTMSSTRRSPTPPPKP